MSVFLDTNILLYAVLNPQSGAEAKQALARALTERPDVAVSLQVIQEFYNQATHPSRKNPLTRTQADAYVDRYRTFAVQEATLALFDEGCRMMALGGFSFWDAMIVAAARAQGCDVLYSEDMQDGRIIDGMRIVDPFRD